MARKLKNYVGGDWVESSASIYTPVVNPATCECTDPGDGTGTYPTQEACEEACGGSPLSDCLALIGETASVLIPLTCPGGSSTPYTNDWIANGPSGAKLIITAGAYTYTFYCDPDTGLLVEIVIGFAMTSPGTIISEGPPIAMSFTGGSIPCLAGQQIIVTT